MESRITTSERDLERFCNSDARNLIAEVFYAELQFVTDESLLDKTVVVSHGMNSRVNSQDVIDLQKEEVYKDGQLRDRIILNIARNGFYHQLPEFLFHPISLSAPGMSNKEVVEAIRTNRKKAEQAVHFFSPFDTMMFHDSVSIFERQLTLFDEPYENVIFKSFTNVFFTKSAPLTAGERYKLFLCLRKVEDYKENLSALEELLLTVCDIDAQMRYVYHYEDDLPYMNLGDCVLGVDSGLDGRLLCELDDVEVKLIFHDSVTESRLKKQMEIVRYILSFFLLSSRDIRLIYTITSNTELVLGQNFLGYDTNL